MRLRGLAAAAVLAGCASFAGRASAVEREQHLGLDLGVPLLEVQLKSTTTLSGGSLGLHYAYGLTDAWNFVADGGASALPFGASRVATVTNVDVGLGYVLDVLRWVPWGAAQVGGYALAGDAVGGTQLLPGAAIAAGLDYKFDRSWAAGAELRQHLLFTQSSTLPSFTQVLLRAEYTWGW